MDEVVKEAERLADGCHVGANPMLLQVVKALAVLSEQMETNNFLLTEAYTIYNHRFR